MVNTLGKAKAGRGKSRNTNKHRQGIPLIIDNLIEKADVILEILDSRFIEKTRNFEIEKKVKRMGKAIIYVLNKSDLVDANKVLQQVELDNLRPYVFFSSKKRKGSSQLRKLIKIESKKTDKESVNIGIIGYPNTGKSSLINFLTGKYSARVSPEAGHTKGIQKIKLSRGLYLIDTPGVIPPEEKLSSADRSKHSQIGAVTWDKTKDPEMVVDQLMKENPGLLEEHYNIDSNGDSEDLIERLGRKMHYLGKGNIVDENKTAKRILKDWQEGKIRIKKFQT